MASKRSFEVSNASDSLINDETRETPQITAPLVLEASSEQPPDGHSLPRSPSPDQGISEHLQPRSERPIASQKSDARLLARRTYAADSSIVLIGIRGTGKSTLAVIAASALRYRVVDADQHFYQVTGESRITFKSKHGVREYRRRELKLMHSILFDNQTRCVITCGPGSVEGKGQEILRDYGKTHPLIYIMRDTEDIKRHLKLWDMETISRLVSLSGPSYRASSTFEFYNISDYPSPLLPDENPLSDRHSPPSLTLKSMEQDFLLLIYHITRQAERTGEHEARHVLSLLPPESRHFTYALSLPLSSLAKDGFKLADSDSVADAVELIMDLPVVTDRKRTFDDSLANFISKQFYLVRRHTRVPIIFHVQWSTIAVTTLPVQASEIEDIYFKLLHHGLRLSPEYMSVDINFSEERVNALLAAKGSTKIIGHYFESHPEVNAWTSQHRKEMLEKAELLGCDIVRLCQNAISMFDNISVQQFSNGIRHSSHPHRPLIAYNTGRLGRMSCCFNPILTPVTHPLLQSVDPDSDSLLTIQDAQNALYASYRLDRLSFSVLGSNIASSLAPDMHNAAFKFCGMPHEYKLSQWSSLKDVGSVIHDSNFGGASITFPFKRDIIPFVDFMSPDARAIGAVNTLVPLRSKKHDAILHRNRAGPVVGIYGENTDWIGIHTSISQNLSPANAVKKNSSALVLGAGGMARAAVYASIRLGIRNIFVQNRTHSSAEEIAQQFNGLAVVDQTDTAPILQPTVNVPSNSDNNCSEATRISSKIRVISTLTEPWPEGFDLPTVIVCCVPPQSFDGQPPANITLRKDWLASKTGGVVVEVCSLCLTTIRETWC